MTQTNPAPDPSKFWFQAHDQRLAIYDASWSTGLSGFRKLAASGGRLHDFVGLFDSSHDDFKGAIDPHLASMLPGFDLGAFADLKAPLRLAVQQGRYAGLADARAIYFAAMAQAIDHCLVHEVDCVVEFGAGLGTNLTRIRLRHPSRPLTYIACEPSENGRAAASAMYAHDPAMRTEVRPFDYADTDLSFLAAYKRPIAFTSHSVEQVPVLGDFYERLLASNVAACVHLEPVGWQRYTNLYDVVHGMFTDPGAYERLTRTYKWVMADSHLSENSAMWSAKHFYNIDLMRLVSAVADSGKIALFALAYDVIGVNPFNPSTLIGWTRR